MKYLAGDLSFKKGELLIILHKGGTCIVVLRFPLDAIYEASTFLHVHVSIYIPRKAGKQAMIPWRGALDSGGDLSSLLEWVVMIFMRAYVPLQSFVESPWERSMHTQFDQYIIEVLSSLRAQREEHRFWCLKRLRHWID